MIDGCDESFVVYHAHRPVRARKEHRCSECGRTIPAGETYYRADGLFEGRWDIYHTCAHCKVACDWLKANCGGFLHHGVEEDIREHVGEYSRMDLARLAVGMGRDWQRFRGGLMPLPKLPRPLKLGDARG